MTDASASTVPASRSDTFVVGLVCTAHFFSHFFMFAVAPLFVLMQRDTGLSFSELGAIMTAFNLASGIAQYFMGVLVDRIGAKSVLITGMILLSAGMLMMGVVESYPMLLLMGLVAGLGNSVFHPADYTILGGVVRQERMGRAFGIHTFSGHLGWAAAPATMIFVATLWNWHMAFVVTGAIGLALAGFVFLNRRALEPRVDASRPAPKPGPSGLGLNLMMSAPVLLMFLFFLVVSFISLGMAGFLPSTLVVTYGFSVVDANTTLTIYLIAGAIGVLAGGWIADKMGRLDLIATVGFLSAGVMMVLVALLPLSDVILIAALAFAGFMLGVIAPSRDLLVRRVAPEGASGRVFAFVSVGLDVGGIFAPLYFGWLLDIRAGEWVLLSSAVILLIAVAAGVGANQLAARKPQPAAAE